MGNISLGTFIPSKADSKMELEHVRLNGPLDVYYVPEYLSTAQEESLLERLSASRSWVASIRGRRLQNLGGMVTAKGLVPAPLPSWASEICKKLTADTQVFGGDANHILVNEYPPGGGIMPHEDGPAYHPAVCILSMGAPAILRFYPKRHKEGSTDSGNAKPKEHLGEEPCAASTSGREENQRDELGARMANDVSCGEEKGVRGGDRERGEGEGAGRRERGGGEGRKKERENTSGTERPLMSVLLERRSLVIFRGNAYEDAMHGIDFVEEETVDDSVVNSAACGVRVGERVGRGGVRVSLTVRRVGRVLKSVVRL